MVFIKIVSSWHISTSASAAGMTACELKKMLSSSSWQRRQKVKDTRAPKLQRIAVDLSSRFAHGGRHSTHCG